MVTIYTRDKVGDNFTHAGIKNNCDTLCRMFVVDGYYQCIVAIDTCTYDVKVFMRNKATNYFDKCFVYKFNLNDSYDMLNHIHDYEVANLINRFKENL